MERLKVLIKSLYRIQEAESGLAASRAFDFLLDVVMEFKFWLVGELHGPVFQFSVGGGIKKKCHMLNIGLKKKNG